ncbi:MAG: hypothetical protein RMJ98_16275 [Myxococcales bacterium]|nr:hypothetical protein [Myxococcales bacterium]
MPRAAMQGDAAVMREAASLVAGLGGQAPEAPGVAPEAPGGMLEALAAVLGALEVIMLEALEAARGAPGAVREAWGGRQGPEGESAQ